MLYVLLLVVVGAMVWCFRTRGGSGPGHAGAAEPVQLAPPLRAQPKLVVCPVNVDINDPTIGNPRGRMKVLGWNQVVVLNNAASGLRIHPSEPGQSNSEDGLGRYFYQPRTVKSLVNAGFLEPCEGDGYVITPLGCKALHTMRERSN